MTRKVLPQTSQSSEKPAQAQQNILTNTDEMHTHRMGSVLEERRDPNFNSWTEIIPERVREAAKGRVALTK